MLFINVVYSRMAYFSPLKVLSVLDGESGRIMFLSYPSLQEVQPRLPKSMKSARVFDFHKVSEWALVAILDNNKAVSVQLDTVNMNSTGYGKYDLTRRAANSR